MSDLYYLLIVAAIYASTHLLVIAIATLTTPAEHTK
jgi:hypothetical protein